MNIIQNYHTIKKELQNLKKSIRLIVISKGQSVDKIETLLQNLHLDFGENKVQEALLKWPNLLNKYTNVHLHLVGKLQSNKAKDAFKIFNYIHTLDNEKLARIFSNLENNSLRKIKYFIQVNIGNEPQKNGISVDKLSEFIKYCIYDLKLSVIGLMCIPPVLGDPNEYFNNLLKLARSNNLTELSMGMSNDYDCAAKHGATFIRVGSKIFSGN
jgi:pyridoxal phosphate enzyme (YggS family)